MLRLRGVGRNIRSIAEDDSVLQGNTALSAISPMIGSL
jgi:hypothetical protein